MSGDVKPSNRQLTAEQIEGFIREPLTQLPPEFQLPTWDFWSFFSDPLGGQFTLASRLRSWIEHDSLTLDELRESFQRMRSLDYGQSLKFANDVLDGLRDMIKSIRKEVRDQERRQRQREMYGPSALQERCTISLSELFEAKSIPQVESTRKDRRA